MAAVSRTGAGKVAWNLRATPIGKKWTQISPGTRMNSLYAIIRAIRVRSRVVRPGLKPRLPPFPFAQTVLWSAFCGEGTFRTQGPAHAGSDFIEMGTNAREPGFTLRPRGRSLPPVRFVSRRAWCRESGLPRSREASGSNPRPPAGSNPQIRSHGNVLSANAGEREMLCRANRRSRAIRSGCGSPRTS